MGLSVRSIQSTDDLQEMIDQINITNNEMTQNFNTLLEALDSKSKEVTSLKTQVESLNVKLREVKSLIYRPSVIKKIQAKNVKLGDSDPLTIDTKTLFCSDTGSLSWSDPSGIITVIVP